MDASIEEIEDRLDPINSILGKLPFGANPDRLRIKLRRLTPEHVTVFRKELRALSSAATKDLPEDQLETRFKDLQRFMAQMRKRDDPRAVPELSDRDRLLDVRKHVEITAERYDSSGTLLSVHSSLGGKSGGESQELVAFIVGAALRFRLGDEARERPRFAPVFLDEGFIKADAEFAGRAVAGVEGPGVPAHRRRTRWTRSPHWTRTWTSCSPSPRTPRPHYSFVSRPPRRDRPRRTVKAPADARRRHQRRLERTWADAISRRRLQRLAARVPHRAADSRTLSAEFDAVPAAVMQWREWAASTGREVARGDPAASHGTDRSCPHTSHVARRRHRQRPCAADPGRTGCTQARARHSVLHASATRMSAGRSSTLRAVDALSDSRLRPAVPRR